MVQETKREDLKNAPVGVFDSGVGGLTVMREIMRQIPNESIIYFGDTARVPYGNKSKETVTRFSRQIVHFLKSHQVKTIVVACNTASAYALDELEKECDIPIMGVVKPGAKAAVEATRNGKIGVIAGGNHRKRYLQPLHKRAEKQRYDLWKGLSPLCSIGGGGAVGGSGDGGDRQKISCRADRQ